MLRWMRRHLGGRGRGGLGALLNGADEVFHATALRAREEFEVRHQQTVPAPSPGDRMLEEGRVVLNDGRHRIAPGGTAGPASARTTRTSL